MLEFEEDRKGLRRLIYASRFIGDEDFGEAVRTIVNASIRSRETFAEVSVPVPLAADLEAALDALREDVAGERDAQVYVSSLADSATVTVRAVAADDVAALQLERELRLRAQKRLRALGVWA